MQAEIPRLVRKPAELKIARRLLGMSAEQLGQMLRVDGGGRTVRRWEAGESEIPGPAIVVLETAMQYLGQRDAILQQIDLLASGTMKTRERTLSRPVETDTTDATITRLIEHKQMFEDALTILTRKPPTKDEDRQPVHWYHLRRMTPKFSPPEKDDWSLPGETGPEAALAYFGRHARLGHELELCDEGDIRADYLLEQRHLIRSQHGASYRIQPGDLVRTFYVRPT